VSERPAAETAELPPLPYREWLDTKTTLHLLLQMVGKVRLALMPSLNHWWHVTLYLSARGLTTRPIPLDGGRRAFEVEIDVPGSVLTVLTTDGGRRGFELEGQPVARLHEQLFGALGELGIHTGILARPYGIEIETPFPEDNEHAAWDHDAVHRFWRILVWVEAVLARFAGRFYGKATPIHLFWHSLDLAYTRFNGARAPELPEADASTREAYTHEVISFGFWAGDDAVPEPSFYSYVHPSPDGLDAEPLEPAAANWNLRLGTPQALLAYEAIRAAADPAEDLLRFFESAYQAGAKLRGWDVEGLRREAG
jgi:hypothetical protein